MGKYIDNLTQQEENKLLVALKFYAILDMPNFNKKFTKYTTDDGYTIYKELDTDNTNTTSEEPNYLAFNDFVVKGNYVKTEILRSMLSRKYGIKYDIDLAEYIKTHDYYTYCKENDFNNDDNNPTA